VAANVGRHALGMDNLGYAKAERLAVYLRARFPHIEAIEGIVSRWENLSAERQAHIESADLIVGCIGGWDSEGLLNEWHVQSQSTIPIVYGWLDENGSAAHAVAVTRASPCLSCLIGDDGNLRVRETEWDKETKLHAEPACGTLFQPFGPLDVAQSATLTTTLALDVLTGRVKDRTHRVYAASTARITSLGGSWSEAHLRARPAGFNGAFEYEREFVRFKNCAVCKP
jgi:hypothetical protein